MNKTIFLLAFAMIFLMSNVSAVQTIYQENANATYKNTNELWINVNYTKPLYYTNDSVWQVQFNRWKGTTPYAETITNNVSLTACLNSGNDVVLRYSAYSTNSENLFLKYECYNGTDWQNLYSPSGSIRNGGACSGGRAGTNLNLVDDGIWNLPVTEGFIPIFKNSSSGYLDFEWTSAYCVASGFNSFVGLQEEAVIWEVREAQSITPLLNGENANLSLSYPQALFISFDGVNSTAVTMTVDGDPVYENQFYIYEAGTYTATWEMPDTVDYVGFTESLTFTVTIPSGYTGLPNKIEGQGTTYEVLNSAGSGITRFVGYMQNSVLVFIFLMGIVVLIISVTILLRNLFQNGLRNFSMRA